MERNDRYAALDTFDNALSDAVVANNRAERLENERMVSDNDVATKLNCPVNGNARAIKRTKNARNLGIFIGNNVGSVVIPRLGKGFGNYLANSPNLCPIISSVI